MDLSPVNLPEKVHIYHIQSILQFPQFSFALYHVFPFNCKLAARSFYLLAPQSFECLFTMLPNITHYLRTIHLFSYLILL